MNNTTLSANPAVEDNQSSQTDPMLSKFKHNDERTAYLENQKLNRMTKEQKDALAAASKVYVDQSNQPKVNEFEIPILFIPLDKQKFFFDELYDPARKSKDTDRQNAQKVKWTATMETLYLCQQYFAYISIITYLHLRGILDHGSETYTECDFRKSNQFYIETLKEVLMIYWFVEYNIDTNTDIKKEELYDNYFNDGFKITTILKISSMMPCEIIPFSYFLQTFSTKIRTGMRLDVNTQTEITRTIDSLQGYKTKINQERAARNKESTAVKELLWDGGILQTGDVEKNTERIKTFISSAMPEAIVATITKKYDGTAAAGVSSSVNRAGNGMEFMNLCYKHFGGFDFFKRCQEKLESFKKSYTSRFTYFFNTFISQKSYVDKNSRKETLQSISGENVLKQWAKRAFNNKLPSLSFNATHKKYTFQQIQAIVEQWFTDEIKTKVEENTVVVDSSSIYPATPDDINEFNKLKIIIAQLLLLCADENNPTVLSQVAEHYQGQLDTQINALKKILDIAVTMFEKNFVLKVQAEDLLNSIANFDMQTFTAIKIAYNRCKDHITLPTEIKNTIFGNLNEKPTSDQIGSFWSEPKNVSYILETLIPNILKIQDTERDANNPITRVNWGTRGMAYSLTNRPIDANQVLLKTKTAKVAFDTFRSRVARRSTRKSIVPSMTPNPSLPVATTSSGLPEDTERQSVNGASNQARSSIISATQSPQVATTTSQPRPAVDVTQSPVINNPTMSIIDQHHFNTHKSDYKKSANALTEQAAAFNKYQQDLAAFNKSQQESVGAPGGRPRGNSLLNRLSGSFHRYQPQTAQPVRGGQRTLRGNRRKEYGISRKKVSGTSKK